MTTLTDPPTQSFQLSQLINDTRYRSYTFQFIALLLLIAGIAYLGSNLARNLAAAGLNISYDFLGEPAGYDINQRLIEYTSQSSHMSAAWVGILNTLLVAFLGCATATVLGVIAGVLRLSKNWLVAKLMAIYVEAFRNVPVLIWIIIINTIVTLLPQPRAYRGETPDAEMLFGAIAFTNRAVYIPAPVWGPGSLFVVLTFIASLFAIYFFRRWATQQLYNEGREINKLWPTLGLFFVPAVLAYLVMGA
ncbi:MAG: ABC transporter permease subunit, partial [Pseudomonadota bacterium]